VIFKRLLGGLDAAQQALDVVHHRQRGRIAVLEDRQQHRPLAVGADDVLLHLAAVAHLRHVAHQDRHAVQHLERDGVQRVHRCRGAIRLDHVLQVAELRQAGRDRDVLRHHGVGDILRGQAVALQRLQVQVHHDLPALADDGAGRVAPGAVTSA